MRPEEKQLIDARRAGYLACWSSEYGPLTDDAHAAAEREFPYPNRPPHGATVEMDGATWACSHEAGRARWVLRIGEGATMGGFGSAYFWLDFGLTELWRGRESKRRAPTAPEGRAQLVRDLRRDINEVADAAMVYGMSLAGGVDSTTDRNANRASVDEQIRRAFERLDRLHEEVAP